MLKSAAEVTKRMAALEKACGAAAERKRLVTVATALKPLATAAAAADLGADSAFSGWRRRGGGDLIPLAVRFTLHNAGVGVTVHRDRLSAGPWRVAHSGRNQGNAGGFAGPGIGITSGVTRRTNAGNVRKVQARKSRRWNGTTAGKGTWDDAVAAMEAKAPRLLVKLHKEAMTAAFVRGKA